MQNKRLYFLDWIRIAAFFMLILYHVGMYYVTWGWHVKSPYASDTIEPLMLLSSPWRMSLLFLVSGVAAAFLLDKLGAVKFVKQRSFRLLLPLVFGMFVIVPPQAYFEVVEKVAYSGSYSDFMQLYVRAYHGFCDKDGCLTLPTWNHLWFLPYLWVYTMILAATGIKRGGDWLARILTGWRLLVLPTALLAAMRILLLSSWPHTNNLVADWHNHATYFPISLAGALLAKQPRFWENTERARFAALGIALACWASLISYYSLPEHLQTMLNTQRVVYALCQWSAIVAVCGFARRHLDFDSPKRRYLTDAVFPVYILHQTLIVCFAHGLKAAKIAPATEGLLLVVLTVTASFGIFEFVRRVPLLRPFFGLPRRENATPVPVLGAAWAADQ
jgi:surface polysaccharide O-acyltransferase-like enzyme